MPFCNFITNYAGKCGIWSDQDRCKKHRDKIEKARPQKGKQYRGNSKFQIEMGYGKNKTGSNA